MGSQYAWPRPFPRPHETNQPIWILHKPQAGTLGNRVGAGREKLSTCTQMERMTSHKNWSLISLYFHQACCGEAGLGGMVNWSWVCAHFIWQGKMEICWQQKWISCHLVCCTTASFHFEIYFPSDSEYCPKSMCSPLVTVRNLIIYCSKCSSQNWIFKWLSSPSSCTVLLPLSTDAGDVTLNFSCT